MAAWRDPITPEEWQQAVDAAEGVLAVKFIEALGFITKGGEVNLARCVDVLERGRDQGISPSDNAVKEFIAETTNELDTEKVYRVFLKSHEMSGYPNLDVIVPFLVADEYA